MPKSHPELAMAMGQRMAARRKELGLTQEAVADIAGMAHQQYNKAENGRICFGSASLQRVSAALKISADYLLTGESGAGKYQEVIATLDKMTDGQLRLAKDVLECMIQFSNEGRK